MAALLVSAAGVSEVLDLRLQWIDDTGGGHPYALDADSGDPVWSWPSEEGL